MGSESPLHLLSETDRIVSIRLVAVIRLGGPERQLPTLERHPSSRSLSFEEDRQAAVLLCGSCLVVASSARSSASLARGNITA